MEPSPSAEMLAVLGSIKESFFRVLPKLTVALFVLCVGWLVAWSLRAIVRRVVERFSKRISTGTAKATWQQALADKGTGRIVSSSIYWLVLLVAVMVTSEVVGIPILTTYLAAIAHYLPKVIVAVAVLFAGIVGGRLISDAATSAAFRLLPHQGRQLARLVPGDHRRRGHSRGDQATRSRCIAADGHLLDRARRGSRRRSLCVWAGCPQHYRQHPRHALRQQVLRRGSAHSPRRRQWAHRTDDLHHRFCRARRRRVGHPRAALLRGALPPHKQGSVQ